MKVHEYAFIKARPVWECGTEKMMNRTVALRTDIEKTDKPVVLAIAAHCSFTVLLNGEIVAHGPARAGHG